jgi:putative ABC transport system permease protein
VRIAAHPLPYASAERLVTLRSTNPSHGVLWTTAAPANLLDWQAQAKSFEAIAGYRWRSVDLTGGDRSERLRGLFITPEFFKVLDVPLMGATFEVEAFNPANPEQRRPGIIIGRGLWRRRYGSDAGLLGSVVDVNIINLSHVGTTSSVVVGVAAADVRSHRKSSSTWC